MDKKDPYKNVNLSIICKIYVKIYTTIGKDHANAWAVQHVDKVLWPKMTPLVRSLLKKKGYKFTKEPPNADPTKPAA